jgi:protein-S-isoprenylcysteine O-methyltransferase Ste14
MALQENFEKQGNWLFRYRGVLPLIFFIAGTVVYAYIEFNPELFILEGTPYEFYYEMGCLAVSLLGLGVRAYTVGYTPADTSGRNTKDGQIAERVNTTGIYSIVRHPLYLGNFLMWFGIALLTGSFWFVIVFCLVFWLYYERIMFAEEQFLRKKFGQTYTDWANKTPAFVPNFKFFVKPDLPFSWKKVLRKEKNGLAALFLVFAFLDILGELIEKDNEYTYFFLIGCIISITAYGILKYMKKKTALLNEDGR